MARDPSPAPIARRRRHRRIDDPRGSVLMLMPAAVLIVVLLGAVAVDRAVVFGAQRDLVATAESAANDAAAAGVGIDRLRGGSHLTYDTAAIDRAVRAATGRSDGVVSSSWRIDGDVLTVHLVRRLDLVFTKGVPVASDTVVVTATATAVLRTS